MPYHSYESLPPDFTLLQNMAAGAFAGIAVSLLPSSLCEQYDWMLKNGQEHTVMFPVDTLKVSHIKTIDQAPKLTVFRRVSR